MSLAIPNTTTQDAYAAATTFPAEQGAGTPYVSGYLIVFNNPATVSVLRGSGQGSANWSADFSFNPTTIPLYAGLDPSTGQVRDYIFGVRARSAVAGSPAQVFGGLFQKGEVALNPGNQTSGTLAPSGGFTPPASGAAMQLIQTQTLAAPAASIAIVVPATFTHLRVIASLRSAVVATLDTPQIVLNSDTGAHYDFETLAGQAAVASAASAVNQAAGNIGACPGSTAVGGYFSTQTIDIANYASVANAPKAWNASSGGLGSGGADLVRTISGVWHPVAAAAISNLSVVLASGANLATGSQVSVYGITG